jgi:hypothetical protein
MAFVRSIQRKRIELTVYWRAYRHIPATFQQHLNVEVVDVDALSVSGDVLVDVSICQHILFVDKLEAVLLLASYADGLLPRIDALCH